MADKIEETAVVIVGAGPSGLALAVNLAKMNINVSDFVLRMPELC